MGDTVGGPSAGSNCYSHLKPIVANILCLDSCSELLSPYSGGVVGPRALLDTEYDTGHQYKRRASPALLDLSSALWDAIAGLNTVRPTASCRLPAGPSTTRQSLLDTDQGSQRAIYFRKHLGAADLELASVMRVCRILVVLFGNRSCSA